MNDTSPTTVAPINTLPFEILARIFTLCKQYCFHESRGHLSLENLMLVCSHWRQIAATTPRLWTHIDIGPTTPSALTMLHLQRASNTPLHLHFVQESSVSQKYIKREFDKLMLSLRDHVRRVRSLELDVCVQTAQLASPVLNLWLDYGSPTLCRSLVIHHTYPTKLLTPRLSRGENSQKMLGSIHALRLHRVKFPWDNAAFRDLVDLRLDLRDCQNRTSPAQIHALLSANPTMVTLKLSGIRIARTKDPIPSIPVRLNELKVLDLRCMLASDLGILLPLIAIPDTTADLCVALPGPEGADDIFESFFERIPITTLVLYTPDHTYPKRLSSRSFPSLSGALLLEGSLITPAISSSIVYTPPHLLPSSSIPNVVLDLCSVTFKGLSELVSRYSVKSLWLERCTTADHSSLAVVRNALLKIYTDLECVVTKGPARPHPAHKWETY